MVSFLQDMLVPLWNKAYGSNQPIFDLTSGLLYEMSSIPDTALVTKNLRKDSPET